MSEKEIKKIFRPKFKLLLVMFISLAIGVIGFLLIYFEDEIFAKTPQKYETVYKNAETKSELYVHANIVDFWQFGTSENGNIFCFAMDENNNKFIVKIRDNVYEEWIKEKNSNEHFSYDLCGYTQKPSVKLKKVAIEQYNYLFYGGKQLLSESNYEERLGVYILDNTYYKSNPFIKVSFFLMAVGIMIAVVALVFFIINVIKFIKCCAAVNMDIIKNELSKKSTIAYQKVGVYLTDQYVITLSGFFVSIVEYKNLTQVYIEENKINFIPCFHAIIGKSIDNKTYNLAISFRRKYFDEIIAIIKNKNTKITAGYFSGDIKAYKNIADKAMWKNNEIDK